MKYDDLVAEAGAKSLSWEQAISLVDRLTAENARMREALERIGKGDVCERLLSMPSKCRRAEDARNALKDHPNDR